MRFVADQVEHLHQKPEENVCMNWGFEQLDDFVHVHLAEFLQLLLVEILENVRFFLKSVRRVRNNFVVENGDNMQLKKVKMAVENHLESLENSLRCFTIICTLFRPNKMRPQKRFKQKLKISLHLQTRCKIFNNLLFQLIQTCTHRKTGTNKPKFHQPPRLHQNSALHEWPLPVVSYQKKPMDCAECQLNVFVGFGSFPELTLELDTFGVEAENRVWVGCVDRAEFFGQTMGEFMCVGFHKQGEYVVFDDEGEDTVDLGGLGMCFVFENRRLMSEDQPRKRIE